MLQIKKLNLPLYKLLLTLGLMLIIIPTAFYINQTIQLTFFTPKEIPHIKTTTAAAPTILSIPAVNMNLTIEETTIHNNTWSVSTKGASHLATSARPTEEGPIILYAHNTVDRFGPIRWLTTGKEIVITTGDGKKYIYSITKTMEVSPDELGIFNQKKETLVLYTCSGFADLKRFIVFASPQSMHK